MPKRAGRIALERVASDTTLSRKTTSKKIHTFGTRFEKIGVEGKSGKVPGTIGAKSKKTTSKKMNTSGTRFDKIVVEGKSGKVRNGEKTRDRNGEKTRDQN